MRRFLLLLAVILVIAPASLWAQLGGLRRRAQEAVRPQQQQQQPAKVQPVPVTITDDVINRYLKGLAAGQEAMARMAREDTPAGRYFRAVLKRDSLQRRQNDFRAETGPDWARARQLDSAMQRGDMAAVQERQRLEASLNPSQVEIPETDWNAQRDGNAVLDSIRVVGSGLSAGEWMYLGCTLPRIVSLMSHNGAVDDSMVTAIARTDPTMTRDQVLAVRARRVELARAHAFGYRTDDQIARAAEDARRQETANQGPDTSTYNGCLSVEMKVVSDSMDARRAEIDAATQRNDIAKLTEISNQITALQQKAQQKCAHLLNQ